MIQNTVRWFIVTE